MTELKIVKSYAEIPQWLIEKIDYANSVDISERYDNDDYYNPAIAEDILYDNGYKLELSVNN